MNAERNGEKVLAFGGKRKELRQVATGWGWGIQTSLIWVLFDAVLIVMARSLDKIKSIDGSKETLKLSVRISYLWFIGMPNKSEQAEMVFVASDGDEIHVVWDIPFRKYRFARFADVVVGQFERGLLVDVIGVVEEVFGKFQEKFVKFLDDYEGDGPITVLLSHCRIKEAQELGIEARSFFKSHGEGSTQLLGFIQLSSKESFFGKAEAKTIAEINTISEEIVCVTVGTITRIVLDNHSWYRLEVMINQGNESTKFLLWDRECSELIGQSADAVNKLKIEDDDVDLNASPQALDKLLGHELAFKINVQPKFRNSAVLKCSADSSLINVVMDMLADAETSSKMDIPVSDSNHSAQHEYEF
ncbi:uncharacterized protein LOC114405156 [Glycine soja]|uniref:uncharacterized protein LOC114405156 n=1 Tax=Glycine soja TaxID=3848 RepID=UPI001040107C|nr:uncharacterized protein LOC114405156 [Glycine soja]